MARKLSVLLVVLVLAGCDGNNDSSGCGSDCTTENNGGEMIHGSGTVKTETRPVEHFTSIELSSSANVVIERTGTESLTVTGDDNLLSLFVAEVKNGTLYLGTAPGKSFRGNTPVFHVTVGDLRTLVVSGSGDIEATKLDGETLSVSITGAGDIDLKGRVDELVVEIDGSGDVDAAELTAKRVKIAISGSGDATVNASDELDAKVTGSGDITYIGSPKVTSDVYGSGSIKQKS